MVNEGNLIFVLGIGIIDWLYNNWSYTGSYQIYNMVNYKLSITSYQFYNIRNITNYQLQVINFTTFEILQIISLLIAACTTFIIIFS